MSRPSPFPDATSQHLVEALDQYRDNVSPNYDEILVEVSGRAAEFGSLGKLDVGALLFWKRLRANTPWVGMLMNLPDAEVRRSTEAMVKAAKDLTVATPDAAGAARAALTSLPGFKGGDALASALILAAAPERMAVYDRRAQQALSLLSIPLKSAPGRYGRYMAIVQGLATAASQYSGHTWRARDVDCALYWLGGNSRL